MTRPPNILWIVVDALRWDRLGCYGYARETSPSIDRLAEEGALYSRAFAQADYSLPSYATMLTGLYPHEHQLETLNDSLDAGILMLPAALQKLGYRTYCINSNPYVSSPFGLDTGFTEHMRSWQARHTGLGALVQRWSQYFGLTDQGAKKATALAQDLIHHAQQPWFLFLVYMDVHQPYAPPAGFISKFQTAGLATALTHPISARWTANVARMGAANDAAKWQRVNALYDAGIAYCDSKLGELVGELKTLDLIDQTAIVVTADHGEFMGERGLAAHGFDLGEALIHVPLLVRYPPAAAPGTIVEQVVELRDIPYTVMALAGGEFDTRSAYPPRNLLTPSAQDPNMAYARRRQRSERERQQYRTKKWFRWVMKHDRGIDLLRTPEFEFKLYDNGERSLYEIEKDRAEEHNIAHDRPDVADELQGMLEEFLAQAASTPQEHEDSEAQPSPYTKAEKKAIEQRLKDLGYL